MQVWISYIIATAALFACAPSAPAVDDPSMSQADLRAFILEVAQRSRSSELDSRSFAQRYDFVHTKITEERNPRGELKKREVERVHNQPAAESKDPGGGTGHHSSPPPDSGDPHADREVSREDFQVDAELLSRFRYTPRGAETIQGRAHQIIDFEPASDDLPAHDFKDKYINQTTGRLWIDTEKQVLTRLHMRLRQPVNVWGGLLGAINEFYFELDRHETPEGDRYTREVRWHLKGRKLFNSKIIDFHEERTDVRRVL